jgi:DNA-3-methyladenine glycosylase I
VHDDRKLFEFLILEGAQAGLSWTTILRKRESFREAFSDFDYETVAEYGEADVRRLLDNPGIVRNRLKIRSAIENARAVLAVQREHGSLDDYIWSFVDGAPHKNSFRHLSELPSSTPTSDRMCNALKARGFKFVGSTICYAFMQAVGLVNDHTIDCFRYHEV